MFPGHFPRVLILFLKWNGQATKFITLILKTQNLGNAYI